MWADPDVVHHVGGRTRDPQDAWFALLRNRGLWDLLGYGYWIVRERRSDVFVGEIGFADFRRGLEPDISGAPEAGWMLAQSAWGKGYASEAAKGWLTFGFEEKGLDQIVSFTAVPNVPSAKVMQRIGMTRHEDWDFDMPFLPKEHWLAAHVVYRMTREDYLKGESR